MNSVKDDVPKLIGIKEAADMLGINPVTLRRWDKDKKSKLRPVIVSKRGDRRYRLADIKRLIEELSV